MPEKILVVDDDVDTLRLVGITLQRQGYEIVAASSGRQAIGMAHAEQPDLIILDVMMPDMDGYEVTRRLRTDQVTAAIPIIMFTAKTQIDDKVTGFEAGADDYLTKPTQPRELLAHVKAVLARTSKGRTGQIAEPLETTAERGHVIGVLAGKGGLGVSTVALNLGIILRGRSQKSVVVAEFRPGQGTIGLELGYIRPTGLTSLLGRKSTEINRKSVESQLITHATGVQLLLSSYQSSDSKNASLVENFEVITKTLSYMASFVILDLGSSYTPMVDKVLNHCDEIILLVEPHPHTITQTKAFIQDLTTKGFGQGRFKVILVNRNRTDVQVHWTHIQEELGLNLAAIITPAPELHYQASVRNMPVIQLQPDSLTAQQYNKLAEQFIKIGHPQPK